MQTGRPVHYPIMPVNYPVDCLTFMSKEGPPDPRFCILEDELVYHTQHNAHFPYLYCILTHALVHLPDHFKLILICVINTSVEARISCTQFDKGLSVPLGPNTLMDKYGMSVDILMATNYESFDLSKTHSLSAQNLVTIFIHSFIHSFIDLSWWPRDSSSNKRICKPLRE